MTVIDTNSKVNAGLDYMFKRLRELATQRGISEVPQRFNRNTLAVCIEVATGQTVDVDDVSNWLQSYRQSQTENSLQRYHLFCEGYARAAIWHVVAGPGIDATLAENALMAHREYVVGDIASRIERDMAHELAPMASVHPAVAEFIRGHIQGQVALTLGSLSNTIETMTSMYEGLTGKSIFDGAELTDDQAELLADMVA